MPISSPSDANSQPGSTEPESALRIIPDVVSGQTVQALAVKDTALCTSKLMIEKDISSILVLDERRQLIGIVTERDLSRRVVALDKRASEVGVDEIMTRDPRAIAPSDSAFDALEIMREMKVRHLPVTESGIPVGMVSMRDIRAAIARAGRPAAGRWWLGRWGRVRRVLLGR